jgi:hypothetical protein
MFIKPIAFAAPLFAGLAFVSPARAEPADVPVTFESSEPDLEIQRRAGTSVGVYQAGRYSGVALIGHYDPICIAPCTAQLPPTTLRLAVSHAGGSPVEAAEPVRLTGPSRVQADYVSRKGTRVAGLVVMGAGLVVGGSLLYLGLSKTERKCTEFYGQTSCDDQRAVDMPLFLAGTTTMLVGSLVGVWLSLQPDTVSFQVAPTSADAKRIDGGTFAFSRRF